MNKPLAFIDLDDTIFQTHRRITPDETFRVGSLDKSGNPRAFLYDAKTAKLFGLAVCKC